MSNTRYEAIVKFSAGCENGIGALIREAISSFFALDLGLRIPAPLLVELPAQFTAGTAYPEESTFIKASCKFAFGSTKLAAGYQILSPAHPMTAPLIQSAAEVFAFDTFVANLDRGPVRPNCMILGDCLHVIDHELAFFMNAILFWKAPWDKGGGDALSSDDKHVFWIHVRKQNINLSTMKDKLDAIDDARLNSYITMLPDEWLAGDGNAIATEIVTYIKNLRANSTAAFNEVVRVLS
ncbi:HipA family kinase [Pseudomonas sp. Bi130]|uniref:HipA family kinase n=1 Tax=Pseudomonas sp. Bi130 TaxID=2821122 RepID=UPI001E531C62|nr:HipA family kinase [Pseudomonas sp. Bi130]